MMRLGLILTTLVGLLYLTREGRGAGTAPIAPAPLFTRHVVPLFSRLGCNAGACHARRQRPERFPAQPLRCRAGPGPRASAARRGRAPPRFARPRRQPAAAQGDRPRDSPGGQAPGRRQFRVPVAARVDRSRRPSTPPRNRASRGCASRPHNRRWRSAGGMDSASTPRSPTAPPKTSPPCASSSRATAASRRSRPTARFAPSAWGTPPWWCATAASRPRRRSSFPARAKRLSRRSRRTTPSTGTSRTSSAASTYPPPRHATTSPSCAAPAST